MLLWGYLDGICQVWVSAEVKQIFWFSFFSINIYFDGLLANKDSFEDELRAFDGCVDGFLACVWDDEISNFPQPESVNKMLIKQMLLCYGSIFACQDNTIKIRLLNNLDQCLKSGKKHSWFNLLVTNACAPLLSRLKSILVQTEISAASRRATTEGLGLLSRVGNDIFTARMLSRPRLSLGMAGCSCCLHATVFAAQCDHNSCCRTCL
ncbi:hypothetical protein ACP4OV_012286 [Aristida adscensionis]